MRVWSLHWEDPLEDEIATQSSTLAWRIPWTEEPVRLQSIELQRVGHDRSNLAHTQEHTDKMSIPVEKGPPHHLCIFHPRYPNHEPSLLSLMKLNAEFCCQN